jgi:hypothetical protein
VEKNELVKIVLPGTSATTIGRIENITTHELDSCPCQPFSQPAISI